MFPSSSSKTCNFEQNYEFPWRYLPVQLPIAADSYPGIQEHCDCLVEPRGHDWNAGQATHGEAGVEDGLAKVPEGHAERCITVSVLICQKTRRRFTLTSGSLTQCTSFTGVFLEFHCHFVVCWLKGKKAAQYFHSRKHETGSNGP